MALVELDAQVRAEKGKGAARRCRQQGLIPGVLYSSGTESKMIAVELRGLDRVLREAHGGAVVLDLKLKGSKEKGLKALIKEIQHDPVTSRPLHLDLMRVSMDKPVRITVPIHLTGIATGVKNEGGFMDHVLREVELECLPAEIPDYLELDVTPLSVGQSLHVRDLSHGGAALLTPGERVIVAIHGKTVAEEPAAEAAVAAEGAEPAAAEGAAEESAKDEGAGQTSD